MCQRERELEAQPTVPHWVVFINYSRKCIHLNRHCLHMRTSALACISILKQGRPNSLYSAVVSANAK